MAPLYNYPEPKYRGGQSQKCSHGLCPSGDSGEMPPCTMGTEGHCHVWECDFQDRKRGDSATTPLRALQQGISAGNSSLSWENIEVWEGLVAC